MSYVITEPCIVKSLCEQCLGIELCPTEAVIADMGFVFVDPEMCIDCGICEAACPHGVVHSLEPIFAQGHWKLSVTKKEQPLVERNREAAQRFRIKAQE